MKLSDETKNIFYQELSALLIQAREEYGLNIEEGAQLLDCYPTTLEKWEGGRVISLQHKSMAQFLRMFAQYGKLLCVSLRPAKATEYTDISLKTLDKFSVQDLSKALNKKLQQKTQP